MRKGLWIDVMLIIGTLLGVFLLIIFAVFGFSGKIQKAEANCKEISRISGAKEYRVDNGHSCYIVKDNKIIKIEDW